eukprot:1275097-Rhodomonas_salina.1
MLLPGGCESGSALRRWPASEGDTPSVCVVCCSRGGQGVGHSESGGRPGNMRSQGAVLPPTRRDRRRLSESASSPKFHTSVNTRPDSPWALPGKPPAPVTASGQCVSSVTQVTVTKLLHVDHDSDIVFSVLAA